MTASTDNTDRYAVIGNPVAHSKSPFIHARFAAETGEALEYGRMLVEVGQFESAVADFFAGGGKGLNVTVPFKEKAFELARSCSPQATLAGAVNTLLLDDSGELYGHNSDGIGLVRDITRNLEQELEGSSILVLGAGGATRGILQPLLEQGPGMLVVANRTPARAVDLAAVFAAFGPVSGCGFADIPPQRFDWIINATAASLQGEVPPLPAAVTGPGSKCYDLMYAAEPTVFCRWAQEQGVALAADGLGMLVEQAAESFRFWRGVQPATAPVIEELRRELSGSR